MWWILGIGLLWIIGVIIKRRIWGTTPSLPKSTPDDHPYWAFPFSVSRSNWDDLGGLGPGSYFSAYWPESEEDD